jgi:hypothetical protein
MLAHTVAKLRGLERAYVRLDGGHIVVTGGSAV